MEFDLPLGGYPGRGISLPLGLNYSSKQWRLEEQTTIPQANGDTKVWTYPTYSENAAAGWTSSLSQPYIEYTGERYRFQADGKPLSLDEVIPPGTPWHSGDSYIKRITVFLPDGSHELRAQDAPIALNNEEIPDESVWNATFYATDGSGMKYVQNSATSLYRLYRPDGSYYDFNTTRENKSATDLMKVRYANKLSDVHGNYIQYNAPDENGVYPYGSWTDQLDRTFPIMIPSKTPDMPSGETVLSQSFTMPGMTAAYTLKWKKLKNTTAATSAFTNFSSQELHYRGPVVASSSTGGVFPSLFTMTTEYLCPGGAQILYAARPYGEDKFNPVVLTDIVLPTGATYTFSYNEFGEVERINYPTGGREEIVYGEVPSLAELTGLYKKTNRGVTERKIYESDSDSTSDTWQFSAAASVNNYRTSVVAPDGTQTDRFMHRGTPPPPCYQQSSGSYYGSRHGYDNVFAGMVYDERVFSSGSPKHILQRTLTKYTATTTATLMALPSTYMQRNSRVFSTQSITYDGDAGISAVSKTEYDTDVDDFGSPQNAIRTKDYAFSVVSGGNSISASEAPPTAAVALSDPTTSATLVKFSETDYLNTSTAGGLAATKAAAATNNVLRLPIASRIKTASGTLVSQSLTTFDTTGRGLPLTNKAWDNTKGTDATNLSNYISTSATFDDYGNKVTSTDGRGNTTTIWYDDTYYAFPETIQSPVPDSAGTYGANTAHTTSTLFDFVTGQPLIKYDVNGQETVMTYDAYTGRPVSVEAPNGQMTYYYYGTPDSNGRFDSSNRFVRVKTQIDSTKWSDSYSWFDGLGRSTLSQQVDSDGDVFVETEYDVMGRVKKTSNPYKTGDTKKWTTPEYDDLSRTKKVIAPDSNEVNFVFGISTSGVIGLTKTATDQAGKKRKGITDALGHMVRVIEDPDSQNLATDYVFDVLGNLRKTTQGDQIRYFSYDSVGRVIRAKQVEQTVNSSLALPAADPVTGNNSWTVKYVYDDNGNITSTVDARNNSITATYDKLNRLTVRDYSDYTPDVSFYYDGKGLSSAPNFSKGQTTKVTSSVSENRYTSFDNMGRILTSQQLTTAGQRSGTETPYTFLYSFNLSGMLMEETYPSGRVVKNTYNTDGELSQVKSKRNSTSGFWNYADAFTYNAAGAVTKLQLGNGHWETATFNDRQQITQMGLGSLNNNQDLLKLEFKYNTGSNADNNGLMREQKITVPTVGGNTGFTATQTYIYDSLNRIQSAAEVISSQTWKQTFSYDRYGNRRFDTTGSNTTTLGSCNQAICNPTVNTANNQFNTSEYYSYDAAGNITNDPNARTYIYDAENRQIEVDDDENNDLGDYSYDGEARRVRKDAQGQTTIFVYDAAGKLAVEYSTELAATPQVSYMTTDHLGSPRVITNENGAVTSREDYSPFGEETITSQRTTALGYKPTTVRQDYTGYEKDIETGLEYSQARYYNTQHGRFTSVDPMDGSASIRNPQSFNRYSYVLNSPYKFVDPLGLAPNDPPGSPTQASQVPVTVGAHPGTIGVVAVGQPGVRGTAEIPTDMLNDLNADRSDYERNSVARAVNREEANASYASELRQADDNEVSSEVIGAAAGATWIAVGAIDNPFCTITSESVSNQYMNDDGKLNFPGVTNNGANLGGGQAGIGGGGTAPSENYNPSGSTIALADAANSQNLTLRRMEGNGEDAFVKKYEKTPIKANLIKGGKEITTNTPFSPDGLRTIYRANIATAKAAAASNPYKPTR
jgi:RHS repeat-associated protein